MRRLVMSRLIWIWTVCKCICCLFYYFCFFSVAYVYARGRKQCRKFHYCLRRVSIKPRLPFSIWNVFFVSKGNLLDFYFLCCSASLFVCLIFQSGSFNFWRCLFLIRNRGKESCRSLVTSLTLKTHPPPPTPPPPPKKKKKKKNLHMKMSPVYVVCWIFLQTLQIYFCIQANSVDPDLPAPRGAVWSGSTLFAKMTLKITSRWHSRRNLLWLAV